MGRSPCCEKAHINKGAWSREEDERLVAYIRVHGEGSWRSLPRAAGLQRCGKSCRLRWINYLRPDVKRGNFTGEEDELIIKLHSLLGNKWSLIAARLPGRTDNEIKNYWNTHIKRKLLGRGVDPLTHLPIAGNRRSDATASFTREESKERSSGESEEESSLSPATVQVQPQQEQWPLGRPCYFDLNLDLTISPPWQHDDRFQHPLLESTAAKKERSTTACLGCGLGLRDSNECRCNSRSIGVSTGMLDYRALRMS